MSAEILRLRLRMTKGEGMTRGEGMTKSVFEIVLLNIVKKGI